MGRPLSNIGRDLKVFVRKKALVDGSGNDIDFSDFGRDADGSGFGADGYLSTDAVKVLDCNITIAQEKKPGEEKTVFFKLTNDELYYFSESQKRYKVPSGDYQVLVGGSSDNLPLKGNFKLTPTSDKPDLLISTVRWVPPFPRARPW